MSLKKEVSTASSGAYAKMALLSKGWNAVFLALLILGAAMVILPMALIVIISFSPQSSITAVGYTFFPQEWSVEAYRYLAKMGDQLRQSYIVTIFYAVAGTALSLFVMTLYAYVISQYNFFWHRHLTWLLFFTMIFSGGLVPSYIVNARYLHLNDSVWIFFLPSLMTAYYVIILRTFLKTSIPGALLESARIDGAGHFTIFLKIVLPLFKAGIATVALFNLIGRWNDWFTGMLYIEKPDLVPLQTLLIKLQNQIDFLKQNTKLASTPDGVTMLRSIPDQNMRMACTLIVILPMIFSYPFFQRYFVSGLTIGSIKE
jgi:putative aldouronate transport system permease protein